jgi:hypothetical protein
MTKAFGSKICDGDVLLVTSEFAYRFDRGLHDQKRISTAKKKKKTDNN